MRHRFSNLGNYVSEQIDKELKELPQITTEVDLSRNELNKLSVAQIVKILKTFPPSVHTVDLSYNSLNNFRPDQWVEILQALGPNVKKLKLSGNELHTEYSWSKESLSADGLKKIFAAIPRTVIDLDISANNLGQFQKNEFIGILGALPPLERLDISHNELGKLQTDLIEVLKILTSLKRLILSNNNIGDLTDKYLQALFKNLSRSLTFLDMTNCNLGAFKSSVDLTKSMQDLPPSLVLLDISDRNSWLEKQDEMDTFIKGLPKQIRGVRTGRNYLVTDYYASWDAPFLSPSILRIRAEIRVLQAAQTGMLVKTGVAKPSTSKIELLRDLESIFTRDLEKMVKDSGSPSDELLSDLRNWDNNHAKAFAEPRNRFSGMFGSSGPTNTQKMIEEIFGRMGLTNAPVAEADGPT